MQQPQTPEQYLDLIEQAQFEVEDLLRCAEEEGDGIQEFASQIPVYQQLSVALRHLHAEVADGSHVYGEGEDLTIMPLGRQWKNRIPFYALVETLNTTHRSGF